jgi:oxalate decarboxylase/phosphoglucose isomerase-like protein (cupin superfamily)
MRRSGEVENTKRGPSARVNRRAVLLSASAASLAAANFFAKAHGLEEASAPGFTYRNDPEQVNFRQLRNHYQGKGAIGVKVFFNDVGITKITTAGLSKPAMLLIYDIPPGASEGVHTHNVGDTKVGSYDEFYYIISGQGEMQIAGERVAVKPGDHVFVPNGVAHGIENTAVDGNLKVYLTAIGR